MRIIHRDLKHRRIKLQTEELDDLWHLQHIVDPGDVVISVTWRRPRVETDKIRPERRKKRRVKLAIRVDKVEFRRHANQLRILGEIELGPDKGKHHTLNLGVDSKLTVVKDWKNDHLRRLREAERASRRPRVLLIAVDDESATFGLVRQYKLEELGRIASETAGKLYKSDRDGSRTKFYNKICRAMEDRMKRGNIPHVVIAGPGFTKKELYSVLKEKFPKVASKAHLGNCSTGGKSGLNEIIRRGIVKRISREDRMSFETELVEKIMGGIAKDGLATYGMREVERALDLGAVKKLLVADEILREKRDKIEPLLKRAKNTGSQVVIVSTEHEAGRRLEKIGGIGGLLRFRPGHHDLA